jgi:hypothetical protein
VRLKKDFLLMRHEKLYILEKRNGAAPGGAPGAV